MKSYSKILSFFLMLISFSSCQNEELSASATTLEINSFIWYGLNDLYLWQEDVPNLADDRFATVTALNSFLSGYTDSEKLFKALLTDSTIDRFSWIVDDYTTLENSLQGNTKSTGIDFGLSYMPNSTTNVFGYVRYIVPNSNASTKDVARGDFFYKVNDVQLTKSNYNKLLFGTNNNLTLSFGYYNGSDILSSGKVISFTKTDLDENPILINKVINTNGYKIGYLMYNGFYYNYDNDLNDAFGTLKSEGITHLVLDLRYNGGGSVATSTYLASMITGQFKDQIFDKLSFNNKNSQYDDTYKFTDKIGTTTINSLNLNTLYVLTSGATASASELIINGLSPYINVIQIGETTYGKNVASITMYDSPNFSANNRSNSHKYAMQPIVAKSVNVNGFGDFTGGISPDYYLEDAVLDYGVLGDTNEPLLSQAIQIITGTSKPFTNQKPIKNRFETISNSKIESGLGGMHLNRKK